LDKWTTSRPGDRPNDPVTDARRRVAFHVVHDAEMTQALVKADRLAEARANLASWAEEFISSGDYRSATAEMRRRQAGEFVTDRLGFASADIRDRLLAATRQGR
jgi:hypothetical protein